MKRVLFLCTHNSARSQMAEGLMNALLVGYATESAGTRPSRVNPFAIRAMAEIGIDISGQRSKSLDEIRGKDFHLVVTLCEDEGEVCPFFPGGKEHMHRGFQDPSAFRGTEEETLKRFIEIRDEIRTWIVDTFR